MTNIFARRSSYATKLYNVDHFILKHLSHFIDDCIKLYIKKDMLVADIGCGEQPLRASIENKGAFYFGIDIQQNEQETVDLIAPITNVPLPDGSFDCIICTEVLEHVFNIDNTFSEISRLLKPKGLFIFTTPFMYSLHEEPFDYHRLTPHALYIYAKTHNFNIINLETIGTSSEVIATIIGNSFMYRSDNFTVKAAQSLFMLFINSLAQIASILFKSNKYFLNTVSILEKK